MALVRGPAGARHLVEFARERGVAPELDPGGNRAPADRPGAARDRGRCRAGASGDRQRPAGPGRSARARLGARLPAVRVGPRRHRFRDHDVCDGARGSGADRALRGARTRPASRQCARAGGRARGRARRKRPPATARPVCRRARRRYVHRTRVLARSGRSVADPGGHRARARRRDRRRPSRARDHARATHGRVPRRRTARATDADRRRDDGP